MERIRINVAKGCCGTRLVILTPSHGKKTEKKDYGKLFEKTIESPCMLYQD